MENQPKKFHHCTHEGCKAAFNRPYRLVQHLLVHNNIRIYVCEESNCSKSYTSRSHLDRHINNVHKSPEKDMLYSCPTCFKNYANRQNLKRHIKIHHKLKVPFTCDVCKAEFRKKNQLSAHICDVCSKDFVSLYEKKKHLRHHKTYNCNECQMRFNTWSKYQKHKKTDHANKEFICHDCGRSFKQRSHIVRHVKIHTKTIFEPKKFLCPYDNCQRWYTRNSNLKQHILIKHLRFTHNCHICKAQLSTKAKLDYHIKLHNQPPKVRQPRTKATGRKERKDKGVPKGSTALKLAGMSKNPVNEDNSTNSLIQICIDVECVYVLDRQASQVPTAKSNKWQNCNNKASKAAQRRSADQLGSATPTQRRDFSHTARIPASPKTRVKTSSGAFVDANVPDHGRLPTTPGG
ncbi:PR domain zinc finger protein 5-like isoform X2 [Galleria mellonella]|uniref:PR domain zinc finger protein 5-like isoform X2 n=1 Tax=Galleria mellonella TaxID=7137 RepID=A0ABM3N491_GALME|nr:PR domain zinc finger protein 5-like isoform X2 [Galleria mellonella]